jgi:outer membrane protein OmpA-like peptidoglycan-associated protein
MASSTALRMMLGASLGLGAIDLLLIDVALAPEVIADSVVSPRFTTQSSLLAVVATGTAAPLAPAPAVAVSPVVKSHVYFATMKATLDDNAQVALDALAVSGAAIVLEGHADERGDDGYNTKLSRKRALAVQRYLVERGADREQIKVRFAGEAGAGDPDLWRDRRVDIQITGGSR